MESSDQRQWKKERRSEKGGVRVNKTPAADNLSSLIPHPVDGVYNNPPLAHTLVSLIGCVVEVQLVSGDVLEGILRAISPNMEIALNVAHIKGQPPTIDSVYNRKEVKFSEVVTISAKTRNNPQLDIFKTDTEISSRPNGPHSRQLQPFTDFSDEDGSVGIMANSEDVSGWSVEEMWAVNQNKFKVSSTYDEELPQYTTPLSRDGEAYKKREIEAIQLANEIESKSTVSRHGVDDLGSEEDRWSAVTREPQSKSSGGTLVKENGSHLSTSTHDIPCTQAPPTTTPPSSITLHMITPTSLSTPPTSTTPTQCLVTNNNIETDSETLSSNSTQLLSNNQTSSPDDVIVTDIDKTNEGLPPIINSERDLQVHASIGEPSTVDDATAIVNESLTVDQPLSSFQTTIPPTATSENEEMKPVPISQSGSGEEKEKAIKNFKLDPKAKEFVVTSFVSSTPSSSSTTAAPGVGGGSPSPVGGHSHTRTHTHTPRTGGSSRYLGNHSQRVRAPIPTSIYPQYTNPADTIMQTAVSSSYMLSQQPGSGMAGLLRPGLMQPGFSQYAVQPNSLVGGMAMPQIITASPHTSMIAANVGTTQQYPLNMMQQQQLFSQPTQTIVTPQGIVMSAAYMGGVPLSPLQQQQHPQMVAAGLNPTMMGTTASSALPRAVAHYQLPGPGK